METLLRFLRMPSTWKGFTFLLTVFGISLSPEQKEAIGLAGIAIVGLIEVFTDEDKRPRNINLQLPPADPIEKPESVFDERGFNKQDRLALRDPRSRGAVLTDLHSKLRIPEMHSENYPENHNERKDQQGFNG